jgi:hypothetical protein
MVGCNGIFVVPKLKTSSALQSNVVATIPRNPQKHIARYRRPFIGQGKREHKCEVASNSLHPGSLKLPLSPSSALSSQIRSQQIKISHIEERT